MTVYIIVHTATRVVRRMTTDDPPFVAEDESAVVRAEGLDLSGVTSAWKLSADGLTAEQPSDEEIALADFKPLPPAAATLVEKAGSVAQDPTVPQSVKDLALAVVALFVPQE